MVARRWRCLTGFHQERRGNPAGRQVGSRIKATSAAEALLEGEAGRIAAVVNTFVRAIETRDFERRLIQAEDSLARQAEAQNSPAGWHN